MVEELGAEGAPAPLEQWAARLWAALERAHEALREGDPDEAEHAAKAVSAVVKALRDIAEFEKFARDRRPITDEEELRADVERRIARYIEADRAEDLLAELERE